MLNLPNIPADDSQIEYSPFYNEYFPDGKSPKYMYVSFWGILPASLYFSTSYDRTPPSGVWKLTQESTNRWELYKAGDYQITYELYQTSWRTMFLYGHRPTPDQVFLSLSDTWPYFNSENYYPYETSLFYSGFSQISWQPNVATAGILDIADSVGIPKTPKTFITPYPQNSISGTYRYCRRIDATNIKIKVSKAM